MGLLKLLRKILHSRQDFTHRRLGQAGGRSRSCRHIRGSNRDEFRKELFYALDEVKGLEGLTQVRGSAESHPEFHIFLVRGSGQHEDADCFSARIVPQGSEHVESIHDWHPHIQNEKIRQKASAELKRSSSVTGFTTIELPVAQNAGNQSTGRGVVVGNNHEGRTFWALSV
jgi:hypothetical protein